MSSERTFKRPKYDDEYTRRIKTERSRDESTDLITNPILPHRHDIVESESIDIMQHDLDQFHSKWTQYIRQNTNRSPSQILSRSITRPNFKNHDDFFNVSESASTTSFESDCKNPSPTNHNLDSNHDTNANVHSNPLHQLQLKQNEMKIHELQQQLDALKRENLNLKDAKAIQWKENQQLKRQYESEQREKQFYQLRLKGLATMIKRGPPPRPERVRMHKSNLRITEQIHRIRTKIKNHHRAQYPSTKWRVVINHFENHQSWTTKKALTQIIKTHIKHNGVDNTKPDILQRKILKKRKNPRRKSNKNIDPINSNHSNTLNNSSDSVNSVHGTSRRSSTGSIATTSTSTSSTSSRSNRNRPIREVDVSGNLNNYNKIPFQCVMEVFIIKEHRIEALRSGYQRGLKARMDIARGTVIGQYIGIEYVDQEFQDVFGHSNEEAVRNVYAFDQTLSVPVDGNNNKNNDDDDEEEVEEVKMIIDGYGLREMVTAERKRNAPTQYSAHLLYINDCRADISNEHPTEEDAKYWRVDFVNAEVNGYGMVFVVARCDVKKGEELLSWYGESYSGALRQQSEYERMKNCLETLIDHTILRGCDMANDVWTID